MKHLLITLLIIYSFLSLESIVYAQDTVSNDLNTWIDSTFTKGLKKHNIAGATIVLTQGDSILHMNGYGLSDIGSNTPIDASSSIFEIASISKTFTATAIMQLYEEGKLDLDRDINNYLTTFQMEYNFKDTITIRHLLTHTAGLDMRSIGSSVREEKNVVSLAQYLKEKRPMQIRPAGKIISYTNEAFALLGLIVEEVSGMPCDEFIEQRILQPLEMNSSSFKRQAELSENYVTGYMQKKGQLIPSKSHFPLDYPAGGLRSTASDMRNYISMYMNNGNYKGTQLLDSTTIAKMLHEPFRHYEKADFGWSMGFQELFWRGIPYYGHGGSTLGFESQLALIPEKKIGVFISANSTHFGYSESRIFIDKFIRELIDRSLSESITEIEKTWSTPEISSVDDPLEKLAGKYRYTFYGHETLSKLAILAGIAPEIEIVVKNDSTLKARQWNLEMQPVSDLTFYSKDYGYLAFERNASGDISHFFAHAYAYDRLKWFETVQFQIFWIGSIVLILLIYIIVSGFRKLFVRNRDRHVLKNVNLSLASLIILFVVLLSYGMMTTDPSEFFLGLPFSIKLALVFPFFIIPIEIVSIYLLIKTIRLKELKTLALLCQSLILVAAVLFIPWLMYYNLIGFNY